MCSIFGILGIQGNYQELRKKAIYCSHLMSHRGPDENGIYEDKNVILLHERLSIVDIKNGHQPITNSNKTNILIMNGEIYNYEKIKKKLCNHYQFHSYSDCEVILALYDKFGEKFLDLLNGMFAFVLYDTKKQCYLIGRDHIGMVPLYIGYDVKKNLYISSEMKALVPVCNTVQEFPPRSYLWSPDGIIRQYYYRKWFQYENIKNEPVNYKKIIFALKKSVNMHLNSDVPYAVLLSGGLDSAIIASITKRSIILKNGKFKRKRLRSFSIGLLNAPDLIASRKLSKILNTKHHEIIFTEQNGLDAIRHVIYHIETYDVTTIRASIPMYLMSRKIKSFGIKMVLSGEGADEIFGGYLYFHYAPSAKDFHEELVRKLKLLHMYDCARANKSMLAWGVEIRFPFLEKNFLDIIMNIHPTHKMCYNKKVEKYILRKAFFEYLPKSVLWRQKEQFSDGVGYSWINSLKKLSENEISDKKFENAHIRFPYNTPYSKEGYLYREIFEELFPISNAIKCIPYGASIACSSSIAANWHQLQNMMPDPSGRTLDIHTSKL